jgi:hypothetical protein
VALGLLEPVSVTLVGAGDIEKPCPEPQLLSWNFVCRKALNLFTYLLIFGGSGVSTQGFVLYKAGTLTVEPHLRSLLLSLFWRWGGLSNYFPWAGLKLRTSQSQLPK